MVFARKRNRQTITARNLEALNMIRFKISRLYYVRILSLPAFSAKPYVPNKVNKVKTVKNVKKGYRKSLSSFPQPI